MTGKIFDSKEYTLKNGLKLVTIKKNTHISSIYAGIKIGSIFEKKCEDGISHFIEHLLYKGTKTMDNEKLNQELENIGGDYNAYTSYDSTVFNVTCLNEELEKAVFLTSDMLQNSVFDNDEIDKERGVVLSEIRASYNDLEDLSYNMINNISFKKSGVRHSTLGDEKTINSLDRKKIVEFYNKYYVPNNCFISVVSDYDHEYIYDMVKKYFEKWEKRDFKRKKVEIEDNIPKTGSIFKKEIELCSITYMYTFFNLTKRQELILRILNNRLGESPNSLLFRELREKRGMAYDVYSSMENTRLFKALYIYTEISKEDMDKAEKIIKHVIEKIKSGEINFTAQTISLMNKMIRTNAAAILENSSSICEYVLEQMMDEESIFEFESDIEEMKSITEKDIKEVANLIFNGASCFKIIPAE